MKSMIYDRRRALLALIMLIVAATAESVNAQARADGPLQRLEREVARLGALSGGKMGVAAIHLEPAAAYRSTARKAFRWQALSRCPWRCSSSRGSIRASSASTRW